MNNGTIAQALATESLAGEHQRILAAINELFNYCAPADYVTTILDLLHDKMHDAGNSGTPSEQWLSDTSFNVNMLAIFIVKIYTEFATIKSTIHLTPSYATK